MSRNIRVTLIPSFTITLVILLSLSSLAVASTVQDENCDIRGDPDVYGIGLRMSFYLQWAALVIFLYTSPQKADIARGTSIILSLAVYIITFRNMREGSLVAVEWPLLFNLTTGLVIYNWPVTKLGFKRNGGSLALLLLVLAVYYLASPWVFFKGLDVGRAPGCRINYVIFVPINLYSHRFHTFLKVTSIFGAVGAVLLLGGAGKLVSLWVSGWGDVEVEEYYQKPNLRSATLGSLQLITGIFTIGFTEKTLRTNHVTFPGTGITNNGQLIPLLIGIFTLCSALLSAFRTAIGKADGG